MNQKRKFRRGVTISLIAAAAVVCVAAGVFAAVTIKAHGGKTEPPSSSAPPKSESVSSTPAVISTTDSSSSQSDPSKPTATTDKIPVLMYHSINYEKNNILRVPIPDFTAEMKWLSDNGYHTMNLDDVYQHLENHQPFPEKSVVLTFDDGYKDNYNAAFPILKQYHFTATIFMITGKIGDSKNGYLTADELKEMSAYGIDIECHTVHHLALDTLSYQQQYDEIANSQKTLESLLGKKADFIAYPSGKYNATTLKVVKELNFKLAFRENGGIAQLGDPQYEFPRFFVGQDLKDFENRVTGKLNLRTKVNE